MGDQLRNELIGETVARAAAGSELYGELYDGVDLNQITTIQDLSRLPIVTKEQLRKAGRSALCWPDDTPVSHIQNTTGTTGEQFFVYRSSAETQFIRHFYARLAAIENGATLPLMLQIQFPHHGSSTPVPANVFVVPFSVSDDHLAQYTILLLRKEFDLPGVERRVSILSGSQTGILVLTSYLLEQEFDFRREFRIKLIHLQGRYLTDRWRRVLEDTWGAAISNKYSLAEIFGGGSWCSRCDGFHFDPHVVPEILDFTGSRVLKDGIGVLLLTSLHPFVQLQPMIRYFTGDIFKLDPNACNQPKFKFLGRLSHALFNPENPEDLWLSGVDLIEALDPHPEINRTTRFRDLTRLQFGQSTGRFLVHGRYKSQKGVWHLSLKVEVCLPLFLYVERRRELETNIVSSLLARSPRLAALTSDGAVKLEVLFLKPGTLASLERITQLWEAE